MVAIVTGNGLGLERSSGLVLGSRGQLGDATFGRYGENVTVNAATGNLMIGRTDEILIGQGPDSIISRAYNSLDTSSGFGTGDSWRLNVQRYVTGLTGTTNTAGSTITLIDWDGSDVVYTYDTSRSAYVSKEGSGPYNTLNFSSGTNLWSWKSGTTLVVETFDNANGGRIVSSKDTDNNTLTYAYTGSNLTRVTVTDGSGVAEHTDLTWSGSNLTQIVTTLQSGATLTRTRYTYDASNRLSTVTTDLTPGDNSISDGNVVITTYTYDGTSSRIASISQTGGALLSITYDTSGRVKTISQTMASGVSNTTTFTYNSGNTTITDQQGQTTTLTYDANKQLTQVALPPAQSGATAQSLSFTYNANGDVLTAIDGSGDVTTYQYDANGNVTLVRDQAGNTVTHTYDANNNVLTETKYFVPDPDGAGSGQPSGSFTTRYAYTAAGHLRFVVSALGEVTKYNYTGAAVSSIYVYRGIAYDVSGLSDTASIAESTLAGWLSSLDLSAVEKTDLTYDFRGNLSTATSYTAADSGSGGLTTAPYKVVTYTYDQYGNLLTSQTTGYNGSGTTYTYNTASFAYDGLGRVTSTTDRNGATTSIAFTDSSNQVVATLANGRVKTSVYNLAGELISYAESGSGITTAATTYAYDAQGQLRMVTDATGNKTYYLYDYVGRKVADIAADGSITEYRYDQSDRLVSTTSYATLVSSANLASLVSSGQPANVLLASIRPSSNAADIWNWRVYDTANRLIETIDGDGAAAIFVYDGASNLVRTTAYANFIASATVAGFKTTAPTTLQTPTADTAHDIVSRSFYDNDGRLIGTLNGDGYLSQIKYNEAGEKVETIAYATIVPSGDRASGTWATLLADVGNVSADLHTRYVYDGEGNLKYRLDNNLRVTEYVYDGAGDVLHTIEYAAPIASAPSSYTVANVAAQIAATSGLSTNVSNRTSWAVYDAAGRVAFVIDANGGVVGFTYDGVGQVVKKVAYAALRSTNSDPSLATMNSWVTSNASSANDRVTRTLYDLRGRAVYTVDAENYVTENRYDLAGRLTLNIRYPSSGYTINDSTTVSGLAGQIGSIPSTAVQTAFSYDVDGRLTDTTDGAGIVTHIVYNALGLVTDKTVAYGTSDAATTHYTYDAAGRQISQTNAYGATEAITSSCTYDGLGHILTQTDGRGYVTTYTYDNLGLLKNVTTPIDASNNATVTNTYDGFGNVIQTNDALGNNTYFFYDNLGRLAYQIDGEGYVTKTDYTIGNEVAQITHYATKVSGSFSSINALAGAITNDSAHDEVTVFTRDLLGRVTKVTDAEGYYEQYTLDAFGNQVIVRNKLGGITNNTFDRRGLLIVETKASESSIRSDGTTQASSVTNKYSYDSRGNRTQMIEAFGLTEQRTTNYVYDKVDRLTWRGSGDLINGVTPSIAYQYDNRGNLILTTDEVGAKTFFYYDHLSRKVASVNAVGTLSFWAYDANGNATSQTVYGDAVALPSSPGGNAPSPVNGSNYRLTSYAYDRANRLTTTTVNSVAYGYYNGSSFVSGTTNLVITNTYDKNGNIISQQDARGGNVYYYYDKRGLKIAQVDQANYLTYYTLDGDGNVTKEERFATAVPSAGTSSDPVTLRSGVAGNAADRITNFTYDKNGHRLTEQRTGIVAYTVNSSNGVLSLASTNATITYTYNGLGEVTSKTEATGDQTIYAYDAYGRQTSVSAPSFTDYTGSSVTPTTVMSYDGLNNLTRTVTNSTLVTRYVYGAGGRLVWSEDASGFSVNHYYDNAGREVLQSYNRTKSDTSYVTEGKFTTYDALGRVISQAAGFWNGSSWVQGDAKQIQYNTYGEVTATGTNGLWQETNQYDNAGRIWKSTAGDGITKIFYYDQNGNQTAQVTSDGNALPSGYAWSSLTLSQASSLGAFGSSAVAGMVTTYKTYDARGQSTSTVEPLRQLGTGKIATIRKQHTYNAFGEVTSDTEWRHNFTNNTDASFTTNYSYNTIGRLVQTQNPSVNVTGENGVTAAANPLQTNYYDLSGRLVAIQDANGYISSRLLLAGTGYGGSEASITKEFHPDSGVKSYGYDVLGNQTRVIDELGNVTKLTYDAMGRLVQLEHPTRAAGSAGNTTGSAQTLIDYYLYDELGQRITHWNNFLGASTKDRSDYDFQGRVTQSIDMAGHTTTVSYSWSSSISTNVYGGGSLGTFGGWVENTTDPTGLTSSVTVDAFNRTISKTDLGGNSSSSSYNLAGQLANQTVAGNEHIEYRYYNTGQLKSIDDITTTVSAPDYSGSYTSHSGWQGVIYHPEYTYLTYQWNGSYYDPVYATSPAWTEYNYDTSYSYVVHHTGPDVPVSYDSCYGVTTYGPSDLVEYLSGWTAHNDVTDTTVTIQKITTTVNDRNTSFEYDEQGNRTYEGSFIQVTGDVATTTTVDSTETVTNFSFTSDTGQYATTVGYTYSYQVADPLTYYYYYGPVFVDDSYVVSYDNCYGATTYGENHTGYHSVQDPTTYYTYYANQWVSDVYSYYDSCYGQTIYAWPTTGSYQAADPTTYHTEYYWVEDGETYYDSCYGSSYFYDYGYGHSVPYQVADPTTYHTVYYTYTAYGYSDPGTYGHYTTVPVTVANSPTYHTEAYTYVTYSNSPQGYYTTALLQGTNPQTYHTAYGTNYSLEAHSINDVNYYQSTPVVTPSHSSSYADPAIASSTTWLESETITYDAMNRVTSISDTGYANAWPMTITMQYDANGNIRERAATFNAMNADGSQGSSTTQDNWYKYDAMNRFVTTKGQLVSGNIVRGSTGVDLTYDLAGNRHTATSTTSDGTARQEIYAYTTDGFLAGANVSMNGGSAAALASYSLDAMGRTTTYKEYDTSGNAVYTRNAQYDAISQVTHDDTALVKSDGTYYSVTDYSYVAQSGTASGVAAGAYLGGVLVHSHTSNSHTPNGGSNTTDASTDYNNTYIMRDSAQISSSTYVSDSTQTVHHDGYWETWTNSYSSTWHDPWDEVLGSTTAWVTNYSYDAQGHLKQVAINDGQPRTVNYVTNMMGEVIKRDVTFNSGSSTAPHEIHYYLAGTAIGDITNNGTSATDYVTQIAARTASNSGSGFNPTVGYTTPNGYGPFRGGANAASPYADFDQSYDPINGYGSTATATNYVIKQGDTLQSLARQIWGDANLWYLIAQANGLNANSVLQVGTNIIIPNNQVHNFHNSSSTFRVYNPNLGVGDVSPTAPEIPAPPPPPPPPPAPVSAKRGGGCGVLGTILIAVVAIAVAVVTYGALAGPASSFAASSLGFSGAVAGGGVAAGSSAAIAGGVLAGAAGGIAGAVVSQGLGVATGLQKSFDWGAVALGAIGGAIGGGLAGAGAFGSLGEIGGAVARGVTGSIVTQGVGVATGLQSHFDWAGVAAAGVGAGVGAFASQQMQLQGGFGFSNHALEVGAERIVSGVAGDIANAATRTLANGSDFGDNIIAALPDAIGSTIGGYWADRIAPPAQSRNGWIQVAANGPLNQLVSTETVTVTAQGLPKWEQNLWKAYYGVGSAVSSALNYAGQAYQRQAEANMLEARANINLAKSAAKSVGQSFVQQAEANRMEAQGAVDLIKKGLAAKAQFDATPMYRDKNGQPGQVPIMDEFGRPAAVDGQTITYTPSWGQVDDLLTTTATIALPEVAAARLASVAQVGKLGLRASTVVSAERAEAFLVKNGFSASRAAEFVGSFDGPITARLVRPGEDFLRYTDVAESTGSFLTKNRFSNPSEAVEGLYLGPYGNSATLVQPVTSTGRSIVLEGSIKNGWAGIGQTVVNSRSAFSFGLGVKY